MNICKRKNVSYCLFLCFKLLKYFIGNQSVYCNRHDMQFLFRLFIVLNLYVMICAIWHYLYNLKNVKNTQGGVLLLVKLQAITCNSTEGNTPPWVFFTFFELYKWYQIAQRTTVLLIVKFIIFVLCRKLWRLGWSCQLKIYFWYNFNL